MNLSNSRRDFIKTTAAAGLGLTVIPSPFLSNAIQTPQIKLGFIGVGNRGRSTLGLALERDDVAVVALCDVQQRSIDLARAVVKKSGKPMPAVVLEGPYGYRKLLDRKDIDAVVISTPWQWHYIQNKDSMLAGKYTGCEVNVALTIEECWDLVHTSEQTGIPLMMLENVCYRRDVMAVLNMVRQDLFGELVHLQGGYIHDVRDGKINYENPAYLTGQDDKVDGPFAEKWRTWHSIHRNGDLYPTHGIGPLAMMLNVNRGNRFTEMVSFSSKSRGLHAYAQRLYGKEDPRSNVTFKLGDVVTTMIRTANEETIFLQHDTNLPHPYSLGFRVEGTRGLWLDIHNSVYFNDGWEQEAEWDNASTWFDKYDHPLWKRFADKAAGAGHGGMDWFVLNAFVESVKRKTNTPQDVYDAVTWTVIAPLSELSIAKGGETVSFPDFTGGNWMYRKNEFALSDDY